MNPDLSKEVALLKDRVTSLENKDQIREQFKALHKVNSEERDPLTNKPISRVTRQKIIIPPEVKFMMQVSTSIAVIFFSIVGIVLYFI